MNEKTGVKFVTAECCLGGVKSQLWKPIFAESNAIQGMYKGRNNNVCQINDSMIMQEERKT